MWILNCRAVHPQGENLLLSKRLQAPKLDLGQASNCRFQVQGREPGFSPTQNPSRVRTFNPLRFFTCTSSS